MLNADRNNTYDVLQGGGPAKDIVFDRVQERLSFFSLLFEFLRGVNVSDVLFESLIIWMSLLGEISKVFAYRATSPAFQREVIVRLNGLDCNPIRTHFNLSSRMKTYPECIGTFEIIRQTRKSLVIWIGHTLQEEQRWWSRLPKQSCSLG